MMVDLYTHDCYKNNTPQNNSSARYLTDRFSLGTSWLKSNITNLATLATVASNPKGERRCLTLRSTANNARKSTSSEPCLNTGKSLAIIAVFGFTHEIKARIGIVSNVFTRKTQPLKK